MSGSTGYERPGIAGSGVIACGLAACATRLGEVHLLARSDPSAWQAEERTEAECKRVDGADPRRLKVTTDSAKLADCDLVVESIVEELEPKAELLGELGVVCEGADLATTTSSLGVSELAGRSGHEGRLFGLHVFNPVTRMELVELCVPDGATEGIAERAGAWCEALGKRAVDVPDQAGFVVNRLLFPYLFDAARMLERTGMEPWQVDACMTLGAGHPMGPLKLLDFVGLDVALAIGRGLHAESGDDAHAAPGSIEGLVADGKLGRKSKAGFYEY